MADNLNVQLAPQFVINIVHEMGGAGGFTIVAGIASTGSSGATMTGAEIKTAYENEADTNAFDDAAVSKLAGIDTGAKDDQTPAEIRTAVAAATDSNVFTDSQQTSLGTMEDGATADQTDAQIRTAVGAATDSNVFQDADASKLDGIESGATTDQTDGQIETAYNSQVAVASAQEMTDGTEVAIRRFSPDNIENMIAIHGSGGGGMSDPEVKTAYENNANTNEFSDAEKTSLATMEDNADVTDAGNVAAAGAVMDGDFTAGEGILRKTGAGAYVAMKSNLGAATNPVVTSDTAAGYVVGSRWINTTLDREYVCLDATNGAAVWTETTGAGGGGMSDAEVKTAYENNADTNEFSDAEKTSLGTMEDNAKDDQTNAEIRTAVGAATDSNVYDDNAVSKLAGIEAGAKDDQTNAEIRTAVAAATDSNVFTDSQQTSLGTMEDNATADQSDSEIATAYGNQVGQVSGGEITTGTETALRTYSPADVVAIIAAHESGAGSPTTVNNFVDDHTLALTDAGDIVEMEKATANVLLIPTNAAVNYPIGTIISIMMMDVGVTSITADATVTLNGVSAGSGEMTGEFGGATLYQRATDVWVVNGAIGDVT